MAFDVGLAQRLREALGEQLAPDALRDQGLPVACVDERRMFGGLAFMHDGHMAIGIAGDALMVRVGPEAYAHALQRPHARVMDFTGKPMKGYVFVDPPGFARDADLQAWITMALQFVRSLPAK